MSRVGLHCAPSAHKTLGTYPAGTLRFSFGPENTPEEVATAFMHLQRSQGFHNKRIIIVLFRRFTFQEIFDLWNSNS